MDQAAGTFLYLLHMATSFNPYLSPAEQALFLLYYSYFTDKETEAQRG